VWDDPANAAARVGHITRPARNDVNVRVRYGLARRLAVVDPDSESIGPKFPRYVSANLDDQLPQLKPFARSEVKHARDVLFGNNQRVPITHWECIRERCGRVILREHTADQTLTERAWLTGGRTHRRRLP
jgi:hypothetical protein